MKTTVLAVLCLVLCGFGCGSPANVQSLSCTYLHVACGGMGGGYGGSAGAGGDVGTGGISGAGGAADAGVSVDSAGTGGAGTGSAIGTGTGGAVAVNCNATPTIVLAGNRILDTSGTPIVRRGGEVVIDGRRNIPDDLAATGANAARVLFSLDAANGLAPADLDAVLGDLTSRGITTIWLSWFTWDDSAPTTITNADGTTTTVTGQRPISAALGGGSFYALTDPVVPAPRSACSKAAPTSCYLAVWSRQWAKDVVEKYKKFLVLDAMQEYTGIAGVDSSTEAGRVNWAADATANVQWFRANGYTAPLEVMSNFGGRDLGAIVEKGPAIRAADTLVINGNPQTMFGWQAYWLDPWYKGWQGDQLLGHGQTITAAQAIPQFAMAQQFPIEIGLDDYPGDAGAEYRAEIDQAALSGANWLWWAWNDDPSVICPVDGATCQAYVTTSTNGFAGTVRSVCGP